MMKLLTILATVFYGGTVLVGADYCLEFRAPATNRASSSNARAQPAMASFIYDCKGHPAGLSAFQARQSLCTLVTSPGQKARIHGTHTFISVYGANLGGHVILLSDRGVMPRNLVWMLGYRNDAIDHPNFAEPSQETVAFLQARVEEMRMNNAVPASMVPAVAQYFAQTNLLAFSRSSNMAKLQLSTFAAFLKKIMERNSNIHLERTPARAESLRAQVTLAIQVSLQKMIDPCSVLPVNLHHLASPYCASYCKFLAIVAGHYGDSPNRCSTYEGGNCVGAVCSCYKVLRNPLAGCQYSLMHECNNAMRMNLLDSWTGPTQ